MASDLKSGSIVSYPYLWRWQQEKGAEHGEKRRPVCLVLVLPDVRQKLTHLMLLPISSSSPFTGQAAIEIPSLELRRAGLSAFKRGWITVSEYNYDVAERSFHFEPGQPPLGQFSPQFLEAIRQKLRLLLERKEGRIDRTR